MHVGYHIARRALPWALSAFLYLSLFPVVESASAPRLLPFQAHLMDGDGHFVEDGVYYMHFSLCDNPTGGELLWSGEAHTLSVRDGLVNVLLGTRTPFPEGFSFNRTLYLRIVVPRTGGGLVIEALPPQILFYPIVPVFFAQDAGSLEGHGWDVFFGEPGGANPAAAPETAQALDAERFIGIREGAMMVTPVDVDAPKVERAYLADSIAADLALPGSLEALGDLAVSGDLGITGTSNIQMETNNRQFLHSASNAVGMGLQSGTLYMRSGRHFAWYRKGVHHNTPWNPGSGGAVDLILQDGSLGVGVVGPKAWVDVTGYNSGAHSMRLRSGMSGLQDATAMQILFGYNGSQQYQHALTSRHGSALQHNRMEFTLWDSMHGLGEAGARKALVIQPEGVGIGGLSGGYGLNVHGAVVAESDKPLFLFKKYTIGTTNMLVTDMEVGEYTPGIVGGKFINGDINEQGVQNVILSMSMRILRHSTFLPFVPPSETGWWTIEMDFASHGTHETKEVTVMFVHNSLVSDSAYM